MASPEAEEDTTAQIRLLVEQVISGGDVGTEELRELLRQPMSREAATAWHQLWHWAADADIRQKDVEFARIQRGELRKLLPTLASGQSSRAVARGASPLATVGLLIEVGVCAATLGGHLALGVPGGAWALAIFPLSFFAAALLVGIPTPKQRGAAALVQCTLGYLPSAPLLAALHVSTTTGADFWVNVVGFLALGVFLVPVATMGVVALGQIRSNLR